MVDCLGSSGILKHQEELDFQGPDAAVHFRYVQDSHDAACLHITYDPADLAPFTHGDARGEVSSGNQLCRRAADLFPQTDASSRLSSATAIQGFLREREREWRNLLCNLRALTPKAEGTQPPNCGYTGG